MIHVSPSEESSPSLTTYGRLAQEQLAALERVVAGQHVLDLGAGNLKLAEVLVKLGAARVTAVDRCFQEADVARLADASSALAHNCTVRCDGRTDCVGGFLLRGQLEDRARERVDVDARKAGSRIALARSCFNDLAAFGCPDARVAFLSWPSTGLHYEYAAAAGLLVILGRCDTVVLVSKNTDGLACGWPGLYAYLGTRPILGYHPRRANTLIVYGRGPVERPLRGEEIAGVSDRVAMAYDSLGEELS